MLPLLAKGTAVEGVETERSFTQIQRWGPTAMVQQRRTVHAMTATTIVGFSSVKETLRNNGLLLRDF